MNSPVFTQHFINDKSYVDIKEVRANCKQYCKGTRSIAQLIERKGFQDVVYGRVKNGEIEITPTMSRQSGTAFVNKDELTELFVNHKDAPVISEAPPLLEVEDLVFFKDEDGREYHVTMRGERTRKGILFRVKDIENVFQMSRLDDHIVEGKSSYKSMVHYQWFVLSVPRGISNQQEGKRELYLTYKGLMRVMYRSNSGVAYKFQDWIDECVFAMNWGTQEQKAKVVARSLNVDADHLKAIMSKCPTAITCLYLIDIGISENNKRVFKYGFTKDIRRRFSEHMKTYGNDIKLDTFVFIPELDLSKAETTFKQSVSRLKYTALADKEELILVCDEAYINVQTIFSTIMDKYCGNIREMNAHYGFKIQDLEAQIVLKEEQCKRIIADKNVELITAIKDIEIAQMKIRLLEMELQLLQARP